MFVDGKRYADVLEDGPVPPVGAKVWAGAWCEVDRVEWYCNKRQVTPNTATMCVDVFMLTLPKVPA